MKPRIAITTKTEELRKREQTTIPVAYAKAIEEAGGIPFIVPILSLTENIVSVAQSFDGFLFSGGDDIRPVYYGEEPLLQLELSPDERTDFELNLLKEVLILKKPVLGICLGIQLMNVALGGSLYQDIPTQIINQFNHRVNHREPHQVAIKEGTLLHRILFPDENSTSTRSRVTVTDPRFSVNSAHHQSVKSPGKGLVVSAVSSDGVIEAVELPDYPFFVGVQWHPEREQPGTIEEGYTKRLFKAFCKQGVV